MINALQYPKLVSSTHNCCRCNLVASKSRHAPGARALGVRPTFGLQWMTTWGVTMWGNTPRNTKPWRKLGGKSKRKSIRFNDRGHMISPCMGTWFRTRSIFGFWFHFRSTKTLRHFSRQPIVMFLFLTAMMAVPLWQYSPQYLRDCEHQYQCNHSSHIFSHIASSR